MVLVVRLSWNLEKMLHINKDIFTKFWGDDDKYDGAQIFDATSKFDDVLSLSKMS